MAWRSCTIGTNRAHSTDTVKTLLDNLHTLSRAEKQGAAGFVRMLRNAGKMFVSNVDWRTIDLAEIQAGQMRGRPREKFTRIAEMLALIDASGSGASCGNTVAAAAS